jgi:hypothetical protein
VERRIMELYIWKELWGLYVYNSSDCSSLAQCTCGNKQEEEEKRRNSNDALVDEEEEEEEESFIAWASRKKPNVVKKNLKKNGIKDQCNNNNNNDQNPKSIYINFPFVCCMERIVELCGFLIRSP